MNGYLNESNFTMVEEGFTPRDLLENLLVGLCPSVRLRAGGSAAPCGRGAAAAAHPSPVLERAASLLRG